MNRKAINIVLILVLISQLFCFASVYSASNDKFEINFSANSGYTHANSVSGVQDYEIVKGQYGKAPGDASIRLYTVGGTYSSPGSQYIQVSPTIEAASSGEYIHVAFEYLRENMYNGLTVQMGMVDSAGNLIYDRALIQYLTSTAGSVRVLNGASNASTGGTHYNYSDFGGSWRRVDMYFSPDSDIATVLLDGAYVVKKKLTTGSSGWGGSKFVPGIKNVFRLRFSQVIDAKASHEPSAVQIDNILVEKVSEIPSTLEYKKIGENIDFDDYMSITGNTYSTSWYSGSADAAVGRFPNYLSAKPSVRFANPSVFSLEKGVYGRQSWDDSLHTAIPSDATPGVNAMGYHPGSSDLEIGYVGQLTFSVANVSSHQSFILKTGDAVFSDGTLSSDLFTMSADTGCFKFFEEDTQTQWEEKKWYKVDMQFKVTEDGTNVDCYVDGVKLVSDYQWSADYLKDIGKLGFDDTPNADYYIDDIFYSVFKSSNCINPSDGRMLMSDDADLSDGIDNAKRTITVAGSYKVEDFFSKITNPENVAVYNASGTKVRTGLLLNCTVKVSNNYGSGIFYTVESAGMVSELELFDIKDESIVVVKDKDTLNVSGSDAQSQVENMEIYCDGKLIKSVDSDEWSVDLSDMPLGKHKFEVYAYYNEKDCYMDTANLILVEEKETNLVELDMEAYTSGTTTISGGRLVQRGGSVISETVQDKNSLSYGKSIVFEGTKSAYVANNSSQSLYFDIYTPSEKMITKAIVEFDVCILNDNAKFAAVYRGKNDVNSANITAANYSAFMLGTSTTFNGSQVISLEKNKWYHIKSMVDVKNKIASYWVDGVCYGENEPMAGGTTMVQIASELRMEMIMPSGVYDSADTFRYVAFDNVKMTEYDELAYIDSIYDDNGDETVAVDTEYLKVQMSSPVESISSNDIVLQSTNGDRNIASAGIDGEDPSIIYVFPENPLTTSDDYTLLIKSGLKSSGTASSKANSGGFRTNSQQLDIVDGGFELNNGKIKFNFKMSNQTQDRKSVTIIAYAYEDGVLKVITPKTVTINSGKNLESYIEVPYVSANADYYAFVADGWTDINPISNKLFTYSY